jgi:hypothetical protein
VVPQAAKAQQAEPSAECLEAPSEDVDDKEFDLVACWEEFDPELFIVKEPDSQSEAQSEPESEVKSELQSEPEAVSEPSMASSDFVFVPPGQISQAATSFKSQVFDPLAW